MGNSKKLRARVIRQGVDVILDERGKQYGDAWKITGAIVAHLARNYDMTVIMSSLYFFNWLIIMNKLVRAMATPGNEDHWLDIAGYAKLVAEDLERETP
jgi:hypothetical protein